MTESIGQPQLDQWTEDVLDEFDRAHEPAEFRILARSLERLDWLYGECCGRRLDPKGADRALARLALVLSHFTLSNRAGFRITGTIVRLLRLKGDIVGTTAYTRTQRSSD